LLVSSDALHVHSTIETNVQISHMLKMPSPLAKEESVAEFSALIAVNALAWVIATIVVYRYRNTKVPTHVMEWMAEIFSIALFVCVATLIVMGMHRGVIPIKLDLPPNNVTNQPTITIPSAVSYADGHVAGTAMASVLAVLPIIEVFSSSDNFKKGRIIASYIVGLTVSLLVHLNAFEHDTLTANIIGTVFLCSLVGFAIVQSIAWKSAQVIFPTILMILVTAGSTAMIFWKKNDVLGGALQWMALLLFCGVVGTSASTNTKHNEKQKAGLTPGLAPDAHKTAKNAVVTKADKPKENTTGNMSTTDAELHVATE